MRPISLAKLIKAIAVCVECEAEIRFANGEGVCRRRLFGRLPLPVRRFTLSPWSQVTGGTSESDLTEYDFDTVKIWADGENIPPCRPLVRTYSRTAFMLALLINRTNKWDDAAYHAARRARLARLPRGMKIRSTDDGQGQIAVIRPFSPNISLDGVLGVLIVLMLATFGCVKCEIRKGRMNCISGLWPFVRKCEISLEGKVNPSPHRYAQWWYDLSEHHNPLGWLPPKFNLPLRLFVEEAITQN